MTKNHTTARQYTRPIVPAQYVGGPVRRESSTRLRSRLGVTYDWTEPARIDHEGGGAVSGQSQPMVAVEGFSGPFDLLVQLIERREIDLLTVSLATVTEQFLDQLATSGLRDPEHLSAFLVVAAKLLLIKSALLLPRSAQPPPDEPVAADPTDLTERLRVYQRFRGAAEVLADRHERGLRSYGHLARPYRTPARPAPAGLDSGLLQCAWHVMIARRTCEPEPTTLEVGRITVAEALGMLGEALNRHSEVTFEALVTSADGRQRYVATFLAVLEMVRLGLASVVQDELFGQITVARRDPALSGPTAD
jgi:segregation and condensation protein A